jgi:mono/diheme cytochrome c family protein
MNRIAIFFLLTIAIVLVTSCSGGAPAETSAPTKPAAAAQERAPTKVPVGAQEMFMTHCAKCHGAKGLGDGPSLGSLRVQAGLNLTILADRSDQELYTTISAGKGSEMPPFELVLRTDERRELVNYIKGTLSKK